MRLCPRLGPFVHCWGLWLGSRMAEVRVQPQISEKQSKDIPGDCKLVFFKNNRFLYHWVRARLSHIISPRFPLVAMSLNTQKKTTYHEDFSKRFTKYKNLHTWHFSVRHNRVHERSSGLHKHPWSKHRSCGHENCILRNHTLWGQPEISFII